MTRATIAIGVLLWASAAGATPLGGSRLALSRIETEPNGGIVLAQRTIEREWGPADDSLVVHTRMEGQRSESAAMLMSALVPGSGQMYVDGAPHGIWFMVVEAAALASGLLLRESGEQARDDAAAYAGTPQDTSANWSFARWISATGNDPGTLQALYDQDREVFFDLIGSEQELLPGWSGNAETTRAGFVDLRATSDRRLHGARWSESLLWVNHMVAAFDAVRVARLHNRALGLGLEWKGSWRHGAPAFSATLKRRF